MAKHILKFDASTMSSEDAQVTLSEALELSEKQEERLFKNKQPITLSDNQFEALSNMPDDDETETDTDASDTNDTNDDRNADEALPVETVEALSVRTADEREATTIGESLSKDIQDFIVETYTHDEKKKVAALILAEKFVKEKTKAVILSWPQPDTKNYGDDESRKPSGNNRPDWRKFKVAGEKTPVTESFYQIMFDDTATGKALQSDYNLADQAYSSFKDNGPLMPKEYKGWKKSECLTRRNLFKSRQRSGASQIRQAIKFVWQCDAWDNLPGVGYMTDRMADGSIRNANDPVRIYDYVKNARGERVPQEAINVTVKTFLRYDLPKAIAAAGGADKVTLEHIIATVGREKKTPDKDTASQAILKLDIKGPADLDNVFSAVNLFLSGEDNAANTKHVAAYLQWLLKPENNASLLNAGRAIVSQEEIWKQIEKPYFAAEAQATAAALAERNFKNKSADNKAAA